MAFNTQNELVNAKNEIIENHKVIIEQLKNENFASEVTHNLMSDIANGVSEVQMAYKIAVTLLRFMNGVILNGLLLWANIQRKVTPENIWEAQLVKKFECEEITE